MLPSIHDIAQWFLHKQAMDHKKLQKLCYYAVAWGYALLDECIVNDGEFQAWVHGPVSPVLFETYKDSFWKELSPDSETIPIFDGQLPDLLKIVWDGYGKMSSDALEALAYTERPWKTARKGHENTFRCEVAIDPKTMRKCYRSQYKGWHPEAFCIGKNRENRQNGI